MSRHQQQSSSELPASPRAQLDSFTSADFKDVFSAPDFDAKEYVDRTSRFVPLDRLSERLQLHVEQVRADLVDVINADYPEFIALSEQLANVNGALLCIRTPLVKLKESLASVQATYTQELQSLTDCLQRQTQVHSARTMLEVIQDANATMGKVEALALELPGGGAAAPAQLAQAKHLERVCGELSRLNFYMTKGAALPLVAALQPRAATATAALRGALRATLEATLPAAGAEAQDAAQRCIHACSVVGEMALVHDVVRAEVMRPAVAAAAAAAAPVADDGANAAAVSAQLAPLLDAARTHLDAPLQALSAVVTERLELAQSFDVLGECALAEVHAAVKAHLPSAFSPAVPASFHANYTAATAFLQWLAQRAPAAATLQLFRASAAKAAFHKEWNLAVYFSLRFQEIAGAAEAAFATGPAPAAKGHALALKQSAALLAALERCRDPAVTFPGVYERFFKLQLQLVLRYGTWLREADAGGDAAVNAPDFAGFEAGSMREWAHDAAPPQLVQLLAEAAAVAAQLREAEAPAVVAQFRGSLCETDLTAMRTAFEEAVSELAAGAGAAEARLVSVACVAASAALLHVRSIAAMYKTPSRPGPSHYVANLLRSAEALKAAPEWSNVPERQRGMLLRQIAMSVTAALTQSFVELLASSAKTQASLSKLRRVSAAPAGAPDGGLSSVAKIQQQLQRDAAEFGRLLDKLLPGLSGELPEYAALLRTVEGGAEAGASAKAHSAENGGAAPQTDAAAATGNGAGDDVPMNGAAGAAYADDGHMEGGAKDSSINGQNRTQADNASLALPVEQEIS